MEVEHFLKEKMIILFSSMCYPNCAQAVQGASVNWMEKVLKNGRP